MEEKLANDCETGVEHNKRHRGESDSSTQTVESFITSDIGNDDDVETEALEQHQETRCDDTYHMNVNENELLNNKLGQLEAFNADVHRYGYKSKKRQRDWKFVALILTLLVIVMIFAFFWEFNEIRDIKSKLALQDPDGKTNPPKAEPFIQQPPNNGFTAISLRGNGQLERGRKGVPILNWERHFIQGEIGFIEGKKIVIKKSGLYNLYAQMFFYRNAAISKRNFTMNPVMDFGISKVSANERVIAATVSINSCRVACTRHVSGIVRLEKDDILSVDTRTPGVYFKMIKEKSLFGTYLISDKQGS